MAHQTIVVLLLILTITASLSDMVKADSAADYDRIVKEAKERRVGNGPCCPENWVKYGGRCFKYQAASTDWASAEKSCLDLDAHLVSINSEDDYQMVKAIIRAYDSQENPTWIGLTGCQKTYTYFWSDGNKVTFTKWNPGEPNGAGTEGCVHMNFGGTKNWNDISCGNKYPSVCTKSINLNAPQCISP